MGMEHPDESSRAVPRGRKLWAVAHATASVCFLAAAPLILQGCASPGIEVTALPAQISYVCANDRVLQVTRSADQRTAKVKLDGREFLLMRADSAAQEKYSDGTHALYLQGERAMLERDAQVLYGPCVSRVALPKTSWPPPD